METSQTFIAFLQHGIARGGFATDDALAAILPLMEQVRAAHDTGLVAPLDGVDRLLARDTHLYFEENFLASPSRHPLRLIPFEKPQSQAIEVVGALRQTADVNDSSLRVDNLLLEQPGQPITQPVYRLHYRSWESSLDHHDELTDIFGLGLIFASVSCGLDLTDRDDLELFVAHRDNLFALNSRLNPVVAAAIVQMTELNRHRRAQDLGRLIERLRRYRDQDADEGFDLRRIKGFRDATLTGKRKLIQAHLRDRLFEISRRNRLIYYKPTLQSLNLTLASVPLLLDYRNVRPEQLFIWRNSLAGELCQGATLKLGNYLRFEDAPYLPGALDGILSQAKRDRNEFGFSQLRLVLVFLRWHNLKEAPDERIHSPLLLLPVELIKKKGVRDVYQLKPTSTEAEINPALRHHLKELYGLKLPEAIELTEQSLDDFHAMLAAQIQTSEPGVTLLKQERPQIQLVHERARQRLNQYRRRLRVSQPDTARFDDIEYSYQRDRFQPLGLQLFLRHIQPSRSPFADLTREQPAPRMPRIVPDQTAEIGKDLYHLRDADHSRLNPYTWEFDLCNLTLGNFNYRKMSLVRDYANLLENDVASAAFDRIFSLDPRPTDDPPLPSLPVEDQHLVVVGDPTQVSAIARARRADSYIIQGPPGTGKSQTITNLIADYVARGKRVLFVCEKRAAIDVVFHRLQRQGLDELCCLIHDSQTDKREFIQNLKQTYELWLQQGDPGPAAEQRRADLSRQITGELNALQRFSDAMQAAPSNAGISTRRLLHRLIELRAERPQLSPVETDQLPDYAHWRTHAPSVERLAATLQDLGQDPRFARHPFRHLHRDIVHADNPVTRLLGHLDRAEPILRQTADAASSVAARTFDDLLAAVAFAARVSTLAQLDLLALLDAHHERRRAFASGIRALQALAESHRQTTAATEGWREKLPATEVGPALATAQAYARNWFAWITPGYWRMRKTLRQRYDFDRHAIRPTWVHVLQQLEAEYQADAAYRQALRQLQADWGLDDPVGCHALLTGIGEPPGWIAGHPEARRLTLDLAAKQSAVAQLESELAAVLDDHRRISLVDVPVVVRDLRANAALLPDIAPCLRELADAPSSLWHALRALALTPRELEAAIAAKTLADSYRHDRLLSGFDGRALARRVQRLDELYKQWLEANAACLRARARRQFLEHVQLAATSATQLSSDQKLFKKAYTQGRRELEHEFGKTMRYRSIRDLANDETGMVIRDLKPVWLMSPLSVSDTIPLATGEFDVVIFDEASQIPLEEAVPAAHRAQQVIVVGDQMQLPPTNFFSASRSDEESLLVEDEDRVVEVDLSAESFLTMAARNLPSTLLGWHYRSRSESLIGFSNASFYAGKLLTVPDRQLTPPGLSEIRVTASEQGDGNVTQLLGRPVSFHFLEKGVYEQRRNAGEARYIAHLVRELLARDTGLSIGIVAFSEAQQGEIESALNDLGRDDNAFRNRIEAEYEREDNGEYCGLFVKNLENVQGDERDVIILSICYGYDANRRMLMNFGPINQRGGEKRLNVIFSRARRHMAVVSSIRHHDITNEYNDGANCLRNFLEYAASLSAGDIATARRVLNNLVAVRDNPIGAATPDAVIDELARQLRASGYKVDTHVGQSQFQCDLAVKLPGMAAYQLGILVDTDTIYRSTDLVERYHARPQVLRAFDWKIVHVLTKDWYHDPDDVMRQLERLLAGHPIEEPRTREPAPVIRADQTDTNAPAHQHDVETPEPPVNPISSPIVADPPSVTPPVTGSVRHFEFVGGGSSKFWEVIVSDCQLYVRFGRIGAKGQTQLKTFATPAAAQAESERLIAEKLRKGYTEIPPASQ